MGIKHKRQAGFGLVLAVGLVFVVIAAIGVIGWQLYNRNATGSTSTTGQRSQTDAYAGWQTYCSSLGGICFKYPADWQKTETSSSMPASTKITITSPSKNVEVVYSPVIMGVGGHCNANTCFFTTKSITPLTAAPTTGLSVVKGVYSNTGTGAVLADYFLGSADLLAPYKLKINQRVDVGAFGGLFTSPADSSVIEELRVRSMPDDGFASDAAASAWLAKPEVMTAGYILSSVYLSKTKQ